MAIKNGGKNEVRIKNKIVLKRKWWEEQNGGKR